MLYKISAPDEYLAITGVGIENVKIEKSAWVWPLQRYKRFSVQPHDYVINMKAMTKEKLEFKLPVVFTIGPDINSRGANTTTLASGEGQNDRARDDRGDALMKYVVLLSQDDDKKQSDDKNQGDGKEQGDDKNQGVDSHVANTITGIIEGETRATVSTMTMEEVFTEREVFKKRISFTIQRELDQFGLRIWNANIKELKDTSDSNYFKSLSQKAHEGASNLARIHVAEAQLKGTVGEAQLRGQQDREVAKIESQTAVEKTQYDMERATANALLKTKKQGLDQEVGIARVTAERNIQAKEEDLKRNVEIKRAGAELERLRATEVVHATIDRESRQQAADADAYRIRVNADATKYATLQAAEADALRRHKDAEGVAAMADAYAKLATAFGGPAGALQYLMLEKNTFVELANANAAAIQGLEPKICVWNTGSGAGGSTDAADTMRNIYQMLPPLMTTINEQTGITLPEWQFGKLNAAQQAMKQEQGESVTVNGKSATVNGKSATVSGKSVTFTGDSVTVVGDHD